MNPPPLQELTNFLRHEAGTPFVAKDTGTPIVEKKSLMILTNSFGKTMLGQLLYLSTKTTYSLP